MGRNISAWLWLAAMAVAIVLTACAPRYGVQAQPIESYSLCSSDPDYGNAPCVVLSLNDGADGYTWVAVDSSGALVSVPMAACASDDGPAPCVWDTTRGDGRAGPGINRYVMIRD